MPVSIDRVETEIDLRPASSGRGESASSRPTTERDEQRALIRSLVLEVIDEELDRINRRHGG
jgi:hypothetical protein